MACLVEYDISDTDISDSETVALPDNGTSAVGDCVDEKMKPTLLPTSENLDELDCNKPNMTVSDRNHGFILQRTGFPDCAGSSSSSEDDESVDVVSGTVTVGVCHDTLGGSDLEPSSSFIAGNTLLLEKDKSGGLNVISDEPTQLVESFMAHRTAKKEIRSRSCSEESWEAGDDVETDDSEAVYDQIVAACNSSHKKRDECENNEGDAVNHSHLDLGFCGPLPEIEKLHITAPEGAVLWKLGEVASVVDILVIIKSISGVPPLNENSVCFTGSRKALGKIFETFGPVTCPLYSIRFNSSDEIEALDLKCPGEDVYFAPDYPKLTISVFVDALTKLKGTDSKFGDSNESDEMPDFSDDEKERQYLAKQRRKKGSGRNLDPESDSSQSVDSGFVNASNSRKRPKQHSRTSMSGDGSSRAFAGNNAPRPDHRQRVRPNYFARGSATGNFRLATPVSSTANPSGLFQLPTVNLASAGVPPAPPAPSFFQPGHASQNIHYKSVDRPSEAGYGNALTNQRFPDMHLTPSQFMSKYSNNLSFPPPAATTSSQISTGPPSNLFHHSEASIYPTTGSTIPFPPSQFNPPRSIQCFPRPNLPAPPPRPCPDQAVRTFWPPTFNYANPNPHQSAGPLRSGGSGACQFRPSLINNNLPPVNLLGNGPPSFGIDRRPIFNSSVVPQSNLRFPFSESSVHIASNAGFSNALPWDNRAYANPNFRPTNSVSNEVSLCTERDVSVFHDPAEVANFSGNRSFGNIEGTDDNQSAANYEPGCDDDRSNLNSTPPFWQ